MINVESPSGTTSRKLRTCTASHLPSNSKMVENRASAVLPISAIDMHCESTFVRMYEEACMPFPEELHTVSILLRSAAKLGGFDVRGRKAGTHFRATSMATTGVKGGVARGMELRHTVMTTQIHAHLTAVSIPEGAPTAL